jgi:hypothetical protein
MVSSLSANYDTSGLAKLITLSYLHGHEQLSFEQMKPWLKNLTTNLKSVFALTELSVLEGINETKD